MKRLLMSLPLAAMLASGCSDSDDEKTPTPPNPEPTRQPQLAVQFEPVDHSVGSWQFFRATFTLENTGTAELPSTGWKLYFSLVRHILEEGKGDATGTQELAKQGVRITPAGKAQSGDYYVMEPVEGFRPIAPGEKREISVLISDWAIMKADAPSGFHITFDGQEPNTAIAVTSTVKIDINNPKHTTRFEDDALPVQTPALRHDENPSAQTLELKSRLLPTPRKVESGTGELALSGNVVISHPAELRGEAAYLVAALGDVLNASITAQTSTGNEQIALSIDPNLDVTGDGTRDAEGYQLEVWDGRVKITGADAAGVFYGIQTLRQLIPAQAYQAAVQRANRPTSISLPVARIADAPGFAFRGMHLDVGRHFQTKETVKKLIDIISHYKINKFNFHLTDDEGWRLETPGLPELTSYGARRGFDLEELEMLHTAFGSGNDLQDGDLIRQKPASPEKANAEVMPRYQGFETATLNFVGKGNGYYTTSDFEEILRYAAERHIEVIPEIDMPGHARAAVKAMEYRYRKLKDLDPAQAAAYRLIDPDDTSKHKSVQGYTDNFVNPCLETTYAFLTKVATEIKARYDAAGVPLKTIHAGGDELPALNPHVWWQGSPLCKANAATQGMTDHQLFNQFFSRWGQIIKDQGAQVTGWDDIIHNGLTLPGFMPMPWSNVWGWGREDDAYKYANQGYKVILSHSTNLYMDLAYNKDPDEPGYYWANFVDEQKTFEYRPFDIYANATHNRMGVPFKPSDWDGKERLTAEGKKNILGMQGLLWAENLKTPEVMEYLAFPKVLGVAERAWNPELPDVSQMPALWGQFTNSLGQYVLPRLGAYRPVDLRDELPDSVGVNYRIPLPGARLMDGKLHASVRYPGLAIEYSADAGKTWTAYTEPVAASAGVQLRTRAPDGRTSRVATLP